MTSTNTSTQTNAFAFYHLPAIVESRARLKSGGIVFRWPHDGIGTEGEFTIKGDVLTVTVAKRKKATQIGGMEPLRLAEMLMGELVREITAKAA